MRTPSSGSQVRNFLGARTTFRVLDPYDHGAQGGCAGWKDAATLVRTDERVAAMRTGGARDDRSPERGGDRANDGMIGDADADLLALHEQHLRHLARRLEDERVRPGQQATQQAILLIVDERELRD